MHALLRLATTSLAVSAARRRAQHAIRHGVVLVAIALIVMIGLGFFVSALWIWVAAQSSALIASLVLGGLFILVALIVYLTGEMSSQTQGNLVAHQDPVSSLVTSLGSAAGMKAPSIGNLLVIAGTGYILGRIAARR